MRWGGPLLSVANTFGARQPGRSNHASRACSKPPRPSRRLPAWHRDRRGLRLLGRVAVRRAPDHSIAKPLTHPSEAMAPVTQERQTDPLAIDLRPPSKPAAAPAAPASPLIALRDDWLRGDNSPDAGVDVHMHPLTLRFDDKDLEREFEEEYFIRTLGQARLALIVGLVLYSVYGFVDVFLAPEQLPQIWLIRYVVVAPAALAGLGFSYSKNFRRFRDLAMTLVILVALLGIIGMTSIIPQPISSLYDVGLFMVIVYAFTLVRLSTLYALVIAAFTLGVYPIAALT